ncbi:MAG TPA: hypothetical protein DIV82_00395 [Brevundimonas diminuta]|nr:hypothetical protein [Brevundimonas diminuta]
MTAARKIEMFKPGYEGPRTEGRMTPLEAQNYARHAEPLIKRLHDAMLTLGALSDENRGGGSTWPEYVHTFADKVGWDADSEPVKLRYRPTAAQLSDFLPTLQLLDGLSPVFMRVLALRAVGEKVGGFSFAVIGERFGRTEAWARRVHAAVVILAARRSGLLAPAPKGWAIVIAGVRFGGWRSFITTARDPSAALYDLRAKSPVELEAAYAFWTAGKAEAAALAKIARQNMLGRVSHGSWHLMSPEDMADLLIEEQTRLERPYDLEPLSLPRATRTARNAARMMGAEVEGGGDA